ncbi:hypothetical protein [uncultured Muribaculum sp.]|uniref:hypothetical protein n=1 Tax=uncultured Muribaculum sp. TaxID=1918613 RepID=UPI00261B1AE8|nr:hypothetical protein [uncultured Muribaculum sp.]
MIITAVDSLHVAAESLKRLYFALVGGEGQTDLAESVERLEAGENKSVIFEGVADDLGDLMGNAGVDGAVNLSECLADESARLRSVEHRGVEAPGIVDHAGGVKKGRVVKIGLVCRVGELQQVIFIQRAESGVKRAI